MAYATTSDVQAVLGAKYTLGASSKPTTSEVSAWLDRMAADLNSALETGGYSTVPLTGSNDLLVAKDFTANAAALRVLYTAWAGQVPQGLAEAWGGWRDWLSELREGKYTFEDQGRPDSGVIRVRQAWRRDAYRDTHTEYDNTDYENT